MHPYPGHGCLCGLADCITGEKPIDRRLVVAQVLCSVDLLVSAREAGAVVASHREMEAFVGASVSAMSLAKLASAA